MADGKLSEVPESIRAAIVEAAGRIAAAAVSRDPGTVEAIGHTEFAVTTAINALVKSLK